MADVVVDLFLNVFALFSLFLGLFSLNLLSLLFLVLLGALCQFLLVLFFLLLDVLLNFGSIIFFLFLDFLGENLTVVNDVITVVSLTLLTELNWVLVISNVLGIVIVIKSAVKLHEFVATLILLLSINFLHLSIFLMLIVENGVGLVLQVSSPHLLLIVMSSNISASLNEVKIALTLLWCSSGTVGLIGVWNIVSIVVVIGHLEELVVSVVASLLLHVVALVVLVEETGEVAVWAQLGIVQLFVIVSNSLHVLRGIDDLWVVWRYIVGRLESVGSMDTLIWIVELEPVSASGGWWVHVLSADAQVLSQSLGGGMLGQGNSLLASIKTDIGIGLEENSVIWSAVLVLNEGLLLLNDGVFESDGADLSKEGHYGERNCFHVLYYKIIISFSLLLILLKYNDKVSYDRGFGVLAK